MQPTGLSLPNKTSGLQLSGCRRLFLRLRRCGAAGSCAGSRARWAWTFRRGAPRRSASLRSASRPLGGFRRGPRRGSPAMSDAQVHPVGRSYMDGPRFCSCTLCTRPQVRRKVLRLKYRVLAVKHVKAGSCFAGQGQKLNSHSATKREDSRAYTKIV